MRKNILQYILVLSTIFLFASCEDFFQVNTDDVLDNDDYISTDSEMYSGYIGITTKLQAIGDKVIYLTDTRGELLEPTINAPSELTSLYYYNDDLSGNSYADPAPYYDVIIACNDYIYKMFEYKKTHSASIDEAHFKALISSTLRVKAWIYLTLGKIYGEAVWFDDPMTEKQDLSKFPLKNLNDIITSCRQLLEVGIEGIDGTLSISWKEWVDPETSTGDSEFRYWDYMTPDYIPLYAEICLWDEDYQKVVDIILPKLNEKFAHTNLDGNNIDWLRSVALAGKFARIWDTKGKDPLRIEAISIIQYNYEYNQTNSLLKHFGTERPNQFLLSPSEVGRARFSDPDFNNLGVKDRDAREGISFRKTTADQWVINKFRPSSSQARPNAYEDDVLIYIYRAAELHFMLAEALNQLDRYPEAATLINSGLSGVFPNGNVTWPGFSNNWTSATEHGTRAYPNAGIRGTFALGNREFFKEPKQEGDPAIDGENLLSDLSAEEIGQAKMKNDLAILDEMLLEFPAEGKIYPAMIRIAKRYNDYNIIADRVCPKYQNGEDIRTKILNGAYFIKWDLKNK